ncbi:TrmH family RNA methyltransferase [Candidatus Saccharibacteria bacterium]|jgi:23S rRNA (guanosine2251-2'-O)-methyltransferase|nr:TrmH family RNA methyltransferase [Candidatus Saccharibacteria bacterium]NCU43635.1 TrmH family RNA methyltransferase [Candidatus Saccharibacteria bacterium]
MTKNPNTQINRNRRQSRQIVVLAHNIRSTHNIGSIFRTAEGFGVEKIIFSGYSPFPMFENEDFARTNRLPHIAKKLDEQIHKTALDSERLVPFSISPDIFETIQGLKAQGYEIAALEQSADSIKLPNLKLEKDAKIALLLGEEVEGIEKTLLEQCDTIIEIPMFGTKESFNVSVAAGIALYKIACE